MIAYILAIMLTDPAARIESRQSRADASDAARLLELYKNDAAQYQFRFADKQDERLELREEPVYRWTNPTRNGGQDGAVFVWTHLGRPEVLGCIFSHPDPGDQRVVNHEFHSLALVPLTAVRASGRLQWTPAVAGIELDPVPDASKPATAASQRLVQIRSIARQFSAYSTDDRGRWELRLLPQPLFRYESTAPEIVDGAVFSFVTSAGTDPEVLLVIEARQSDVGAKWHYAVARFSDLNLWVHHDDREVWSFKNPARTPTADAAMTDRYRFFRDRVIPDIVAAGPRDEGRQNP